MRTTLFRVVPAAAGIGALAVTVTAGPAFAQADPPGNNGTVKVDDVPFDDHPDNEPHVGCEFQIDFYGYDEGDLSAGVTFEAQDPTGEGVLLTDEVFIGQDPAGGGEDLDASETYDLSEALAAFEPHPEQGFHVMLTVNAEGSIGADVKHKVFWVQECVPPETTPSTGPTTPTTGPHETTPTTPGVEATTPTTAPGQLPVTGSNTAPLLLSAMGLIGLGGAGLAAARRLRASKAQ